MNLASVGVLVGVTTFRQLILIGQVGLVVHIKLLSNLNLSVITFICYIVAVFVTISVILT